MNLAQINPAPRADNAFLDWRSSTPCGSADPELFFDLAASSPAAEAEAKALCGGCQVRERCLDAAMLSGEEFGIWGGMSPDERSAYKWRWERQHGGRAAVRSLRQGFAPVDPTHVPPRYRARFEAAKRCRDLLVASDLSHRRQEFLQVLELIASHPGEDSGRLARRLDISKAWFNTVKREVYALFGVKEADEEDVA